MPIAAAYMVHSPPMIVPEVGKGSEKQIRLGYLSSYHRILPALSQA